MTPVGAHVAVRIAGIGATEFTRRSGRSPRSLALSAATSALADAGVQASEVDAVVPVGGAIFTDDVIEDLRLRESVFDAAPAPGGNSGVAALGVAEAVVRAGRGRQVLIVFARNGSSASRIEGRVTSLPGQEFRTYLERPQGWVVPAQWYAMIARRHMIEFGTPRAALAAVALTMRAHAQHHPGAQLHGRPLSEADYYDAPLITDPYHRWDCCLETDGAVALLVSAADGRPTDRQVPVLAVESSRPPSPEDLTNRPDWFDIGLSRAAPAAYDRAGVGPSDVDAAMIYDCFTFEVLHQLEEAGFCARGASGEFVLSGAIALEGSLPVNTHGGLLAEGHLGGVSHVAEAVRQLRNEAGRRQVQGARLCAVTGWGDWGDGSLALLGSSGGFSA